MPRLNNTNHLSTLQSLCGRHAVPAIRASLLSQWLRLNDLTDYPTSDFAVPESILSAPSLVSADLHLAIQSLFPSLSLKTLEATFEALLEYDQKRHTGTVLTPEFIIDYLLASSYAIRGNASNTIPTVCDPACGYGGFLIPALRFIASTFSLSLSEAARQYVYGLDINSDSVEIAKLMIRLYVLESREDPKNIHINIFAGDSLLDNAQEIRNRTGIDGGFDILVTNPPYIKLQNLTPCYREQLLAIYPEFTAGSFSTAMLFLIAGYRLLSPTGCLGYITQNNLFTSLAGLEIRKFISTKSCLRRIIDFGHARIFSNASADTCLIFLSPSKADTFEYARLFRNVNSANLRSATLSEIPHASLKPSKWRLAASTHTPNLGKLESQGPALGELFTLRVGFATLKDKVFFVRAIGNSVVGETPTGNTIEIEPEITRPAIKISEFGSESDLSSNTRRIIFPYERATKKYAPLTEGVLLNRFPNCYRYLQTWQEALSTRDKGLRQIEPWYAWGRTQSMDAPGPKLLTKTFSNRPNFLCDNTDSLFCNGYAVFPKTNGSSLFCLQFPLEVIQAILNSAIMDYYLRLTSFQIEGDYQCYQKNFIERLTIPPLSEEQQAVIVSLNGMQRDKYLCDLYRLDYNSVLDLLAE